MESFYLKNATLINSARKNFLIKYLPDIKNLTVLETGCGPVGTLTKTLLNMGGLVTSQDARNESIEKLKKLNLNIETEVYDLNRENCIRKNYDVIFSFGTLYHLDNPSMALKNMSLKTNKFIIISTILTASKEKNINRVRENSKSFDQSFTSIGCRPTRIWVMEELKKYFTYIYMPFELPEHKEFKSNIQNTNCIDRVSRRDIFLATNDETLVNKDLWIQV